MPISRAVARTIVPWGRIVFGTVCVTAPDAALKSFMVSPAANSDGQILIRVFGSRAFVLGALSAGLAGPDAARRAIRAGAVMDAVDVGSMTLAHRSGRMSTGAYVYNAAIGIAYSGLGFYASLMPFLMTGFKGVATAIVAVLYAVCDLALAQWFRVQARRAAPRARAVVRLPDS